MARALKLAKKGELSCSPNPMVGCVIADEKGQVFGEGYHQKAGEAHAEVYALQAMQNAKQNLSNAQLTAYVTLEPCSHFGRTPPCADALIQAGIKRVVIASTDPNPRVNGGGIARLRAAGVEVISGLMQAQADALNAAFFTRMRTKRPQVILKLASSLDGKTALKNGESQWITSAFSRKDVQLERARSCAILTGSGTALFDNPRLNVRLEELDSKAAGLFQVRKAQPLRVVIDGQNSLHDQLHLISDPFPTLVYNHSANQALASSSANNVEQVQLPPQASSSKNEQYIDLARMLDDLGQREVNRLWVEGGAKLAGALLDAQLIDRVILYLAPCFLGGQARELLASKPLESLENKLSGRISSVKQIGDDIKLSVELRT